VRHNRLSTRPVRISKNLGECSGRDACRDITEADATTNYQTKQFRDLHSQKRRPKKKKKVQNNNKNKKTIARGQK
jgi:hypothetical protein